MQQQSTPSPRLGLALGGGSARGFAHIGVLEVLRDEDVPVHAIAGTSIGSIIGGLAAAGTLDDHVERLLALNPTQLLGLASPTVSRQGLFHGRKGVKFLRELTGSLRIEDLATPFAAVATDADTGEEIHVVDGDLADAMRASFSIPGVFSPQRLGERWLVDGGVTAPVPVAAARALGADVVVSVNLINRNREGDASSPAPSETASAESARTDPPSIATVLIKSFDWMQVTLAELQLTQHPPEVAIEPRVGSYSLLDFRRGREMVESGREAARAALPAIRAVLSPPEPA